MSDSHAPQDAPPASDTEAGISAPRPGTAPSWTTWVPTAPSSPSSRRLPSSPSSPGSSAPPPPAPASPTQLPAGPQAYGDGAAAPEITYLPAPSGPNWGLVVLGLFFVVVAAGVVANQVAGFQVDQLTETGPSVLVVAGLACAVVGIVGIITRRR